MSVNPASLPYVKLIAQHCATDCGIAALAMYMNISYEDALAASAVVTKDSKLHRRGVYATHLIAIGKQLGVKLVKRRSFDPESSCGLMVVEFPNKDEERHVVFLKHGLIYDPADLSVWEAEAYQEEHSAIFAFLLTIKNDGI